MATIIRYAIRGQVEWDAMPPSEQSGYANHYISWDAYQTAQVKNIVAVDEEHHIEFFADGASYWDGVSLSFNTGWVTDPTHRLIIKAAPGHEPNGLFNSGARIGPESGADWLLVIDAGADEHVLFQDIGIIALSPNGGIFQYPSDNWAFDRCVIDTTYTPFFYSTTNIFSFCMLRATADIFESPTWSTPGYTLDSCTLIASAGGRGLDLGGATVAGVTLRNTVFVGFSDDINGIVGTSSNNATTNSVGEGASFIITGVNPPVDFFDTTTNNYHLSETSQLRGQGVNQISLYSVDIDRDQLPVSDVWDIGSDYRPPAVVSVPLNVTVLDKSTGSPIPTARVYLLLETDSTELTFGETNINGVFSTFVDYVEDVAIVGWVRQWDLVGNDYTPEDVAATLTFNGLDLTIKLKPISI